MSKAYLTIDDVSTKFTPQIVDYLCEKGIKAVMFADGVNALRCKEEAIHALKKGFILGNHSFSHVHFSELDFEQAKEEIDKQEKVLEELYALAGVPREVKIFRFPFGDKGGENREAIQEYLKSLGFVKLDDRQIDFEWYRTYKVDQEVDTFWTFDFGEYQIREGSSFSFGDVVDTVYDRKEDNPRYLLKDGTTHIVLIHDHAETEQLEPGYFARLIDLVVAEGVEFMEPKFRFI